MISLLHHAALFAALAVIAPAAARAQRADTLALSLPEAVALALRAGDEVRLAAAQVDVADAQVAVARSGALPQLRLSGGYTHVYASARGQAVGRFFSQPNTYTVNGAATQTLFEGGRVVAGWRAAARLRSAARLDASEARAQVSLDVQRAYLEALFTNRLVEIQTANYELATARLSQVEEFQRAGRAARYDVLRTKVERANLEPLLIQGRTDRDLALLDLKRLLNIPVDRPVRLTTAVDARSVEALLASPDADPGRVEERASVRSARLVAEARHHAVTAAKADYWPTVSVFLNWGAQAFPDVGLPTGSGRTFVDTIPCQPGAAPGQVCTRSGNNGGWFADRNVGVVLSWPIFDGLRTQGSVDLARAQARQADLQLAQEREAVALEVARARANFEQARALFAARRQNVTEADESFRLASLRFARGLGTQLEVTDAQLALLTAQTNEARAVYDLYLASAELARAEGRPIPLPPPSAPATRTSMTPETSATPPAR